MKGLGYKALSRLPSLVFLLVALAKVHSGQSALWPWHVPCMPYGVLAFADRGAVEGVRAKCGVTRHHLVRTAMLHGQVSLAHDML